MSTGDKLSPDQNKILEYVRESDAISGIDFNLKSDRSKRHLDIAMVLTQRPHKLVPALLVNYALTGQTEGVLRVNTEFTQRGLVPHADKVRTCLTDWECEVRGILEQKGTADLAALDRACLIAHHKLVCILPFRVATSRTARLMLLHIRTLLGLPVVVIRNDEAEEYYAQLSTFREKVFLPLLHAHELASK